MSEKTVSAETWVAGEAAKVYVTDPDTGVRTEIQEADHGLSLSVRHVPDCICPPSFLSLPLVDEYQITVDDLGLVRLDRKTVGECRIASVRQMVGVFDGSDDVSSIICFGKVLDFFIRQGYVGWARLTGIITFPIRTSNGASPRTAICAYTYGFESVDHLNAIVGFEAFSKEGGVPSEPWPLDLVANLVGPSETP